ncbi:MAG TPA: aminoglycoside 3'-phosphotransferase/choline kinase family protein [Gammaproteobacteria bacterium]|jgi:hygromycin-B 7''-O-kinase|nr:aminoglycoside 3'-phosphotransferase/choline kinase family protein [Gammaproteobacteria bacterium]
MKNLPPVSSDEEYEALKINNKIFEDAALEIVARHHLPAEALSLFDGTNIVFAYGNNHVIKIFPPFHQHQHTSDLLMMNYLHNKLSVDTPAIEYHGTIDNWPYIVMSRLDGTLLEGLWETLDHNNKKIIIRELGALIREVHALPTQDLEAIDSHWEQFISKQITECLSRHETTKLSEKLLQQLPNYLKSAEERLPTIKNPVILTGEYTPMNFLVKQTSGVWHIAGLIDFGDAMLGLPEYDLLGPGAFLIQGDKMLLREFLTAYGYSQEALTPMLSNQLTLLMLLHRYSNLRVQIRIENWMNKVNTLQELENLVWGLSE